MSSNVAQFCFETYPVSVHPCNSSVFLLLPTLKSNFAIFLLFLKLQSGAKGVMDQGCCLELRRICFNFEHKQAFAMKDFRGRVNSAFRFQHHLLVFLMNCFQRRCNGMFSLKKDVLFGRNLPGREPLSPCPAH